MHYGDGTSEIRPVEFVDDVVNWIPNDLGTVADERVGWWGEYVAGGGTKKIRPLGVGLEESPSR